MSCNDSKKPTPSPSNVVPDLLVRIHELPNNIGCYGHHLKPGEKLLSPTYNALGAINSGDKKALHRLYGARRPGQGSSEAEPYPGSVRDPSEGQQDVRELGRRIRDAADRRGGGKMRGSATDEAVTAAVRELLDQTDGPEDAMLYVDDLAREITETLDLLETDYYELKDKIRLAIAGQQPGA